jgi:hypothetical protein
MEEFVAKALSQDPQLSDLIAPVTEILKASRWSIERLSGSEAEQRLITALRDPWKGYRESKEVHRRLKDITPEALEDVSGASVAIAASLVDFARVAPEPRKESAQDFVKFAHQVCKRILSEAPESIMSGLEAAKLIAQDLQQQYLEHKFCRYKGEIIPLSLPDVKPSSSPIIDYFQFYSSVVLLGVSGCGKTYSIFQASLEKPCMFFLAQPSTLMLHFHQLAEEALRTPSLSAVDERILLGNLFSHIVLARFVVYILMEVEKSIWFFLQYLSIPVDDLTRAVLEYIGPVSFLKTLRVFKDFFVAVDECQMYFEPKFENCLKSVSSPDSKVSFARLYTCEILPFKIALAGTHLRLQFVDRFFSGEQRLSRLERSLSITTCQKIRSRPYGIIVASSFHS